MLPADACGFVMEDFSGYSLSWSPFLANRIVVAASQYYGIVGNGTLRCARPSLMRLVSFFSPPQAACTCWT